MLRTAMAKRAVHRPTAFAVGIVVAALVSCTSTGSESAAPSISSTEASTVGQGAVTLDGVPFAVCRPRSINGTFQDGYDVAWTFAEEPTPGSGCDGKPGVQFVGVGTADHVDQFS